METTVEQQLAEAKAEIARLRACFDRAVATYPQNVVLPRALESWWMNWYRSYVGEK